MAEKPVKEVGRHIHLSFHHKGWQIQPRHRHPKSEELLYLLKGRLNHTLGDKTITMSAGDVIIIPLGIFHNAACIRAEDTEMIVVYSQGHVDSNWKRAHEPKYRSYAR